MTTPGGYREIPPPPELRRAVATFWVWEGDGGTRTRVLPDGCSDIIFSVHAGAAGERQSLTAVGTMTRPLDASRRGVEQLVAVRFRPGGGAPLLGCPADALLDQRPDLDALWGPEARRLAERLADARGAEGRLAVLADALRRRASSALPPDAAVARCVERIERSGGRIGVEILARDVGLGARQLRRRFRTAVGVGPKELGRIVRLQGVLERALGRGSAGWAELALEAGYFDQSHMIGDFRRWTGESPTRHLRRRLSDSSRTPPPDAR